MKLNMKNVVSLLLLFIIPLLVSSSPYYTYVLSLALINSILAISLNFLTGYLGLINFAIAGLAGLGGYTSAYLTMKMGFPFWAALPISGGVVAILGVFLSLPSLRLKKIYFAIITLVIQIILTQVFTNWKEFTQGDTGIFSIPSPNFSFGNVVLKISGTAYTYLILIIFIASTLFIKHITSGAFGLKNICTRDDEILAQHLGLDTAKHKMVAFFASAFIIGICGSLQVHLTTFISPRTCNILVSFGLLAMVNFGGRGTFLGPIIGALVLTILPYSLVALYPFRNFIYGLLLIICTCLFPGGLIGAFHKLFGIIKQS